MPRRACETAHSLYQNRTLKNIILQVPVGNHFIRIVALVLNLVNTE